MDGLIPSFPGIFPKFTLIDDPGIAFSLELGLDLISTDFMHIGGDFRAMINTSPTHEHFGVSPLTIMIQAEGEISIMNFIYLHGSFTIQMRAFLADMNTNLPSQVLKREDEKKA